MVLSDPKTSTPTLLAHLLHVAETHMQVTAAIAQEPTDAAQDVRKQLQAQQRALYACIRQAEYVAENLKSARSDFDPSAWQARIAELRRRNAALSNERGYAEQRQAAERQKTSILIPTYTRPPSGLPFLLAGDRARRRRRSGSRDVPAPPR